MKFGGLLGGVLYQEHAGRILKVLAKETMQAETRSDGETRGNGRWQRED